MILAENKSGIQLTEYIQTSEFGTVKYDPVSSAYAIIKVNEKLLLGFNIWRKQWEFPAGKLEANETPRDAAIRELFEETHQTVDQLCFKGLFKIFDEINNESRYRAVFFGKINELKNFIHEENDEMDRILLWDMKEDIGYIDEVDLKMIDIILA